MTQNLSLERQCFEVLTNIQIQHGNRLFLYQKAAHPICGSTELVGLVRLLSDLLLGSLLRLLQWHQYVLVLHSSIPEQAFTPRAMLSETVAVQQASKIFTALRVEYPHLGRRPRLS